MSAKSAIEWTDATWNPVAGCTHVSTGCKNCYADKLHTQRHEAWKKGNWPTAPAQYHLPFTTVQALESRLDAPLHWKKPRRIFVNSMSDLFHEDVPDEFIDKVFAVMMLCPQHTFQILTKRPERMAVGTSEPEWDWPPPNVWLGTSVENQEQADKRIPHLLSTPAAVRFLSIEPLLGPVKLHPGMAKGTLRQPTNDMLHWVIVGGESGARARPMHPDWARSIRDQCNAAGVPFFFKQWGEWLPFNQRRLESQNKAIDRACNSGTKYTWDILDGDVNTYRVGKVQAGRLLDGREWNEFPNQETSA